MKRYLIVGLGSRCQMYLDAILFTYSDRAAIVALCDINPHRLKLALEQAHSAGADPAVGGPSEFENLVSGRNVDTVIVTSIDRTHDEYIVRAMNAGCDVIVEKPLTIDERRLGRIEEARRRTGRSIRVTFNYRYAPRNSVIRQLLQDEQVIGSVRSVHFEWLLDVRHGADYFRRWHRDKRNSGGLLVHKATHHFDLVNWWLDDTPDTVFAVGDLVFYGRENAERRGMERFYDRGTYADPGDPFALDLSKDSALKALYLDAERFDGYRRDENVFGNYISIEDDMAVLVTYRSGVRLSYHLTAYSPWEGFRVAFNGDKGRLQYDTMEAAGISGSEEDKRANDPTGSREDEDAPAGHNGSVATVRLFPLFGPARDVAGNIADESGHGGGDARLLSDVFAVGATSDPLARAADHTAGMQSVAVGIAANKSIAMGLPVRVSDLLPS